MQTTDESVPLEHQALAISLGERLTAQTKEDETQKIEDEDKEMKVDGKMTAR